MSDFVTWEPGETVLCVLCNWKRGGDDPPGNWMRHRPSHRRRIPIYGELLYSWLPPLGYFEYVQS